MRWTALTLGITLMLGAPAITGCGSDSVPVVGDATSAERGVSVAPTTSASAAPQAVDGVPKNWPADVPIPWFLPLLSEEVQGESLVTTWQMPKEGFAGDVLAPFTEAVSAAFDEGSREFTDGAGSGSYSRESGTLTFIVKDGVLTVTYTPAAP